MAVMFRLQCFEGETKWCPFEDDKFKYIFLYGIVSLFFFQIWLKCISKFPYRNLLYHLNILLWEGIKRRAQDMMSLKWKRFP